MLLHQVLANVLFVTIGATAGLVLAMLGYHWHRTRHDGSKERDIQSLSLVLAQYATRSSDAATLKAAAAAVPAETFWETLENYADALYGEEWSRISHVVKEVPAVQKEALNLDHPAPWRRALAARHLGMLDDRTHVDAIRATMIQGPTIATLAAALALARLKDRSALSWLLDHPEATDGQGRHRMTSLLKRFGRRFTGEVRHGLRKRQAEGTIYLAAIEVLGVWRDARSRDLLEATLLVARLEARVAAARALGGLRARASVPALCEALTDPAWQVRAQAARSLGHIRLNAAVPHLARATRDSSWWVRRNAAYALARQGASGMKALHRESQMGRDRYAREMTIEALQMLEWDRHSRGGLARVE